MPDSSGAGCEGGCKTKSGIADGNDVVRWHSESSCMPLLKQTNKRTPICVVTAIVNCPQIGDQCFSSWKLRLGHGNLPDMSDGITRPTVP